MHSWKSTNLDCQLIKIFSEKYLRGRSKLKRENVRDFFGFQFKNTRNTLFPGLFWKSEKHAKRLLDQVILMWHINKNLRKIKQSKHKILVRNVNHLETGYALLQTPSRPCSAACSQPIKPWSAAVLNFSKPWSATCSQLNKPWIYSRTCSLHLFLKQRYQAHTHISNNIWTCSVNTLNQWLHLGLLSSKPYIRIGSTISPFLMMTNQMTILTFSTKTKMGANQSMYTRTHKTQKNF